MRTDIKKTDVYSFNELSYSAKEKAREWWRNGETFEHEQEYILEDCKEIAKMLGIDIDNIYYSGFSSQGDGACFTGSYSYKKGSLKTIKNYAPKDENLHQIALDLYRTQRRYFYQLSASVSHSGHYYHEMCTNINVEWDNENYYSYNAPEDAEDAISEHLRDFMHWIYARLESAYEYNMSDENVDENITINEYEFTEDGEIY